MAAPLYYVRLELFDEAVDRHHRSYVSAVLGHSPRTIRCRTTRTLMSIHQRWIPKYVIHIYYLFLFLYSSKATRCRTSRLVEGDRLRAEVPRAERLTRFSYDAPLIAAFMDRWRPETPTFHSPVGEMTLSLEDAAMLVGLPRCW
jgi:hypothetical protein